MKTKTFSPVSKWNASLIYEGGTFGFFNEMEKKKKEKSFEEMLAAINETYSR